MEDKMQETPASQNVTELKNVSRKYYLGKTLISALSDVSLDVHREDFLVIAGPSGSGKTTLLNIIGLIDKPDSGEVWFSNQNTSQKNLSRLYKYRRDNIGYIFQTFNLVPVLSLFENVEYPLILNRIPPKKRKDQVAKTLQKVGLYERRKHRPNELSGGERQRAAVARAVVKNPALVLADEPTANLDSRTGISILELMMELHTKDKTTFIFSSHDPRIIGMGKRVVHLHDGKINNIERT